MQERFKPGHIVRPLIKGLVMLCAACGMCAAQRYSFREYTQGLVNLNIASMVQDRTGYLWVGTQNGLYRYDGTEFQSFGVAQGLPERMVENLYVGADGTLWVATTTGIYYERRDGHFTEVRTPANSNQFLQRAGTVFTSNKPDQVVTVTRTGAFLLRRTRDEQWTAEPMQLEGNSLWSALYGSDGVLWYGCDSDLCKFENGKSTRMGAALGLPDEKWTNLLLTRSGHIWMRGTLRIGELDPRTKRFELRNLPGVKSPEPYPALAEDTQGRVITSTGSDFAMWDKDHWRMVTGKNGLSGFEIQDLFVDREGSVWIGEVGHGLRRWVGQDRWEGYTEADGLSDDLVWSSMRDSKGRLWIGTESGLDWIPAGEVNPRLWKQPGILTTRAGGLAESSDGAIWMGSATGSLLRIDPNTLSGKQWKLPEVFNVIADQHGHIWAATNSGLYQMDASHPLGAPVLIEDHAFKSPRQRISDIYLDSTSRLWVAADQGVVVLDQNGWHEIDLGSSGAKPDLIAVDHEGEIWAGGASQDLMRLTVRNYKVVNTKHVGRPPLLSQQSVALMIDQRGWVWVGQDAGLSVFDGHAWRNYTQDDGLLWNDTDSFALSEDKDGSIWIGTSGGLSHLTAPMNAPPASTQAPVFSKVTYGSTALGNGASVDWGSSTLEVSMALLSFKGTRDTGLRYRLVGGQGSEWEDTRDMVVHYRQLGPGNYRFEVAETDQTGHAISPVASYSFRILPRWWQDRMLQVGLILFIIAAIVAQWRHRVGVLLKQKRHLEEAVKLRTADLEREKGELVRTKEQMRHYAEHDDLTGLWNHRIIVERLRIEVDRSRREGLPVSIILVDLDFFKRINDTYGHPAGDQVLKEASAKFQQMVRTYDWVGRYGGEEFLLILPGSGFAQARQRAEELRMAIQKASVHEGENKIPVTASFGVASGFPSSHEELIREADTALYRAKNNGRNCVVSVEVDERRLMIQRAG